MELQATQPIRVLGVYQAPRSTFVCTDEVTRTHLLRSGLAVPAPPPTALAWYGLPGADLRVMPDEAPPWRRVVACLNVWNDHRSLVRSVDTWLPHVDHVIAIDGPYASAGDTTGHSTDGTLEFLERLPSVTVIHGRETPWRDQATKRSEYFRHAQPGDLLFVVDADEWVTGAEFLRRLPACEVGWVEVRTPTIYRRSSRQPRCFAADPALRYDQRHHWVWRGRELLTSHQYAGPGHEHRIVEGLRITNQRVFRTTSRMEAARRIRAAAVPREVPAVGLSQTSDNRVGARETLRIVHLASYDAGMVVYRLHSAINTTTPHASVFVAGRQRNAFNSPRQLQVPANLPQLRAALEEADVVHCHIDYAMLLGEIPGLSVPRDRVVIHHHGSMLRKMATWHDAQDQRIAGLRLVSNLDLLSYAPDAVFLPNPVPWARYQALGQRLRPPYPAPGGIFRVAHSPTKRHFKGTDVFLRAVETLQGQGVPVEAVLIEGCSHRESLERRATCHASFDSFWLGMQCSGLEGAAMGQPVIAGDPVVADRYREWLGQVPYTYANDEEELIAVLARLTQEAAYYNEETSRVGDYVRQHHDYAAVALRYLDVLDDALHWRARLQVIQSPMPERIETPRSASLDTLDPQPVAVPASEAIQT